MRFHWPLHPLGELTDPARPITYGVVKPGIEDALDGVALVRGGDIFEGRINADLRTITRSLSNQYKRTVLRGGELVMSLVGNPGHVAVVPAALAGANLARQAGLIALGATVEPSFLQYYFMSPGGRAVLTSRMKGSVQVVINLADLRDIEVPVPDLLTQRRIASILSAYDDLIENCQRRIRILEDMARGLYREWFVHFRFPGADALPRVDSQLGPIPQGWHVSTIGALTSKIGSGSTPRGGKDVYERAGISLIRSLNVYDYRFEPANLAFINDEQASTLRNVELRERDVLLNITGASVARCCLTPSYALPARVNQHVAIVRTDPQLANPFFVLDSINNEQNKQRLLGLAQGGATREALTKETIANFALIVPSVKLMQRYEFIASPIHQQRETLARRVANLRRTRDLLLPRLLSGQIGVGVAESMAGAEATEPAAAA